LRVTIPCIEEATMTTATPGEIAERLVEQAPDERWLRALIDDLDRRIRTEPLERFLALWGLSASEGARAFGVSRQAFSKWLDLGPPSERAPAVANLATATERLARCVKRERIPAVVRRPAEVLGGSSLYEAACAGRHAEVRDAVNAMFDLRRTQP
jgi:hypothetical protein